MIGQTVSHYRIIDKLGEGGMGVVYRAEDTQLKRTVALKLLPRETIADPVAKARLLHEAQAAAALDHTNVCTVHEIGEADGQAYIVMAYVEGESLRDKVGRAPLPLETVLDIAKQTAEGLAQAHHKGVVHRDIKPANVMVTDSGQVKILDFGLAHADWQSRLTRTGATVGTVAYMAPEQATGAESSDTRTDIWSFGVLLYEMISGHPPFRAEHEQAVLYSILNETPEPLTAIRTGIPIELERIVGKAMAKRPEDRYQHVEDMLVDLKAVEKQIAAAKTSGPSRAVLARRPRKTYLAAGLIFVVVAIAAAVLIQRGLRSGGRIAESGGGKIRSLAVLPFDNLMNDPEQDYFVEGMHDALITGLSKLGSLRVISRTSVMQFGDTQKPLPEIARELDVDALIEGSVLRVGDEVQIAAQLIDGATDEHLWAESYKRDLRDILTMINDVAGTIAGEVQATLTPEQRASLTSARAVDPDAYEALLRANQLFNTLRPKDVLESIKYYKRAIEIDPEFAQAWGGEAAAYMILSVLGAPPADVMPRAREAALKALEIDEGVAVAHTAMGYVLLYFDRDWEVGGREFRRAIDIDPNDAMARHGYADYLMATGRVDESVDEVIRGRRSNPLSPLANAVVIGHLYVARRYEAVVEESIKLLALNPDYPAIKGFLRGAYWQTGEREKSVELFRDSAWANRPENREVLDRGYAQSGPAGVMLEAARLLEARSDSAYTSPLTIAGFYAKAGRFDLAMDWLDRAESVREPTIVHSLLDPVFDELRGTPRFEALRRRLNLPG